MRLDILLSQSREALAAAGISNADHEAGWLLSQLRGDSPVRLPSPFEKEFPDELLPEYQSRISRRIHGEPLQYIMGDVDFHCVNLLVGPGVLIPRPETEQLVDIALEHLAIDGPILDLCTGSGAIALALAASRPARHIDATELSPEAFAWASKNKARLQANNVSLYLGDLFEPLPGQRQYALITSNPPYVSPQEYETLDPLVRDYEPHMALVAQDDGLALLRAIAKQAFSRLVQDGWLLCEIGEQQGNAVQGILLEAGYSMVTIRKDDAGRDRFALAKR